MTDTDQQITPADATIVSTGTGTKGPEERELPESLSNDMSLCLRILRDVLGEYDPQLLATFDTVRNYAVKASAEHFAGATADPHPDEDGLAKAVATIDAMNLHDAQLLARAFATYFHLANLSEENYRVSVLHQRENQVEDDEAVDPVNELTTAYHQLLTEMGPAKAKALLEKLEFHPVFTAHPTEARRKAVEGKIRRIAELLEENKRLGGSDKKENVRRLYNEIDALFRTSPIALKKPTPVEEADTILDIFDNTLFTTIPKVYHRFNDWLLGDKAGLEQPQCPAFFHPGSWIGSDRYGNPVLAIRHLESVAAATLLQSAPSVEKTNTEMTEKYAQMTEVLDNASHERFLDLLNTPDFAPWFSIVTPLTEVGLLPIGSRPAKRGLGAKSLDDLRTIPWVFSWAQARINLAAWYGLGSACEKFGDLDTLREAYEEWPLFSTFIDNIEMSLAKTDERIAKMYLALGDDENLSKKVLDEMKLTTKWVLKIVNDEWPLQHRHVLGQAIRIRSPYVDALSVTQVLALRSLRKKVDKEELSKSQQAGFIYLILCTVSGVAAGLQNTG